MMVIAACGEQAQEQAAQNTQPRESFNGYLAYPNDMEEMQARIDERDLHGATQAYLWSMANVICTFHSSYRILET